MNIREQLTHEVDSFLVRHGVAASTFGRQAIGDWRLVRRLRAGEDIRVSTVERVRQFMADYKPRADAGAGE